MQDRWERREKEAEGWQNKVKVKWNKAVRRCSFTLPFLLWVLAHNVPWKTTKGMKRRYTRGEKERSDY